MDIGLLAMMFDDMILNDWCLKTSYFTRYSVAVIIIIQLHVLTRCGHNSPSRIKRHRSSVNPPLHNARPKDDRNLSPISMYLPHWSNSLYTSLL
ncbi:predicted protein [Lichtheimia corymbifera JMRC:FSU:9682]|uniref:Uncharacterized protein n=1 Tax=Lichtheimia corymbifera JMRC:FSU:9682 TaxID=1263082 RepID=A0A068S394_9FUNG|nr:predicted protein [Lichtheimia corymbifera JMRC:FSU:9682]